MSSKFNDIVALEDISPDKDHFFRVEWNLGRRCNFDCSYCSPSIHDKKSPHIDLHIVHSTSKKLADYARRNGKKIRISLTGGEPFLHPEFFEILTTIKANGVNKISVTSNGSMPASKYIESVQWIDYLILSIHFEFSNLKKVEEKILQIQEEVTRFKAEGKNRGLHIHLMALPGKVSEALKIQENLQKAGVQVAMRRIRPQFNTEGDYLMPFTSGQLGGHPKRKSVIERNNSRYYSDLELNQLGVSP